MPAGSLKSAIAKFSVNWRGSICSRLYPLCGAATFPSGDKSLRLVAMDIAKDAFGFICEANLGKVGAAPDRSAFPAPGTGAACEPARQTRCLPAAIPARATAPIAHDRPMRRTGVSGVKSPSRFSPRAVMASRISSVFHIAACSVMACCRLSATEWSRA